MPDERSQNELTAAIAKEARRLQEDALYVQVGHREAAVGWDKWHWRLGIPATITAAAAGVTSISGAGTEVGLWSGMVAGILSLGVAAMSALITFLDPKSQAAEHYRASNGYASLVGDLRRFCDLECKKAMSTSDLEKALAQLKEKYDKLGEHTPLIPTGAMDRASKSIAAGHYEYKVDAT